MVVRREGKPRMYNPKPRPYDRIDQAISSKEDDSVSFAVCGLSTWSSKPEPPDPNAVVSLAFV